MLFFEQRRNDENPACVVALLRQPPIGGDATTTRVFTSFDDHFLRHCHNSTERFSGTVDDIQMVESP
jgi:hypothetical protein